MANNYLLISEQLPLPPNASAAIAWVEFQLQSVLYSEGGKIYEAGDELPESVDTYSMARFIAEAPESVGLDKQNCYEDPFAHKIEEGEGSIWIYIEEGGDLDSLAYFVQLYLQNFATEPDQYWTGTWATICSKPRIGEFGGGGLFVTAAEIKMQNAYCQVDEWKREWEAAHPKETPDVL